ncbi:MAG TPA: DUF3379 family protein [Woeseiaceae bacterium]
MMQCDDYRECIAADPSESFDGGAGHAADCVACGNYRDEIRALDERIAAALSIAVPALQLPELPSVDAGAPGSIVDLHGRRPAQRLALPAWIGIAATLAAVAFLATRMLAPELAAPSLAEQVIAHMDHEQSSRQVTSVAVPEQVLGRVIDDDVATMETGRQLVSYAMSCIINGKSAPHLVIQGVNGPVTLILMAEEQIDAAIPLAGNNVHGVIVPVGSGSIAIIGERVEQLNEIDEIGRRLVETVTWKT